MIPTLREVQRPWVLLGADLADQLDEVAAGLCDAIHAELEELPDAMRPATLNACAAHVANVARLLELDEEPAGARAPAESLQWVLEALRYGIEIETVVRKYRIGHAAFIAWAMERLEVLLRPDDVPEGTRAFSEWTFAYVGAVTDEVIRAYQREHERWVRSASALRSEDVRRLLDGRLDDEHAASSRLGYELRRGHCAIVCWSDQPPDGGSLPDLERVARQLAQAVGGGDVLAVTLGPDLVAAWTSPTRAVDWAQETCAAAVDAGVHVAIGEPHSGLEGFRRSYQEALEVRRLAMLTGRAPGRPRRYRDVALTALLTQDLDQAQAFAQEVLGELAEDSDGARRLAATLRVFLDEHGSHARTARRLGVHENTVAYRLKKVVEKLGRGTDEARLETWTALVLHDVLRRAGRVP